MAAARGGPLGLRWLRSRRTVPAEAKGQRPALREMRAPRASQDADRAHTHSCAQNGALREPGMAAVGPEKREGGSCVPPPTSGQAGRGSWPQADGGTWQLCPGPHPPEQGAAGHAGRGQDPPAGLRGRGRAVPGSEGPEREDARPGVHTSEGRLARAGRHCRERGTQTGSGRGSGAARKRAGALCRPGPETGEAGQGLTSFFTQALTDSADTASTLRSGLFFQRPVQPEASLFPLRNLTNRESTIQSKHVVGCVSPSPKCTSRAPETRGQPSP